MPIRQPGELNTFEVKRYAKAVKISWPAHPSSWRANYTIFLAKVTPASGQSNAIRNSWTAWAPVPAANPLPSPSNFGNKLVGDVEEDSEWVEHMGSEAEVVKIRLKRQASTGTGATIGPVTITKGFYQSLGKDQ